MGSTTILIIAVVVLSLLAVGFILVPYLKNKGLVNQQSVDVTKQILGIAQLVLQGIQINNKGVKDQANLVFDITQKVVQYIEQTMKDSDNSHKKQYAIEATKDILGKVGIVLNSDNQKLVDIGIEAAVNALPKTNKPAPTPIKEVPITYESKLPDVPYFTGFTGAVPVPVVEPAPAPVEAPVVRESEPTPASIAPPVKVGSSDI